MTIQQVTEYFMMKSLVNMKAMISIRKLSCMVFMAQAHSFAMRGIPIVDCTFCANDIGPERWEVSSHYRNSLRSYREEAVNFNKRVGSVMRGKSPASVFKITDEEVSILDDVYEELKLEKVTLIEEKLRAPGTPWNDVYKKGRQVKIPNEIVKYYYSLPENRIMTIAEKEIIKEKEDMERNRLMREQLSVVVVAKWFVKKAMEDSKPLGIYKLMCMCYYAQGQAYKELGHRLFSEPIRKRDTGPYIAQVYHVFKKWLKDDLDPAMVVKVPSIEQRHLACREVPISLEGIYKRYMYMPTNIIVAQALDEVPFAIPKDCEVSESFMRIEFVNRGDNHVYR